MGPCGRQGSVNGLYRPVCEWLALPPEFRVKLHGTGSARKVTFFKWVKGICPMSNIPITWYQVSNKCGSDAAATTAATTSPTILICDAPPILALLSGRRKPREGDTDPDPTIWVTEGKLTLKCSNRRKKLLHWYSRRSCAMLGIYILLSPRLHSVSTLDTIYPA